MPKTDIWLFKDGEGSVPLQDWLDLLKEREPAAYRKCLQRILLLANRGNELRRPHADYLRDGIHELRAWHKRKNYRLLYFFYPKRRHTAVISHGIEKESDVPSEEIEAAVYHSKLVNVDPKKYTTLDD